MLCTLRGGGTKVATLATSLPPVAALWRSRAPVCSSAPAALLRCGATLCSRTAPAAQRPRQPARLRGGEVRPRGYAAPGASSRPRAGWRGLRATRRAAGAARYRLRRQRRCPPPALAGARLPGSVFGWAPATLGPQAAGQARACGASRSAAPPASDAARSRGRLRRAFGASGLRPRRCASASRRRAPPPGGAARARPVGRRPSRGARRCRGRPRGLRPHRAPAGARVAAGKQRLAGHALGQARRALRAPCGSCRLAAPGPRCGRAVLRLPGQG